MGGDSQKELVGAEDGNGYQRRAGRDGRGKRQRAEGARLIGFHLDGYGTNLAGRARGRKREVGGHLAIDAELHGKRAGAEIRVFNLQESCFFDWRDSEGEQSFAAERNLLPS